MDSFVWSFSSFVLGMAFMIAVSGLFCLFLSRVIDDDEIDQAIEGGRDDEPTR